MKKFTRIFGAVCMMGLLTFGSTSCKKDKEDGETAISVTVPGFETVGDRAYITQNGVFMWHENDFIRVYNLANEENADESTTAVYNKIGSTSTHVARFRGPYLGSRKAEGYRYFYPSNMVKGTPEEIQTNLWNGNRQTFVVSSRQQYHSYEQNGHHYSLVDPSAMPMATHVNKLSENATLRHLFGVATFSLHAAAGTTVVVDSVVLSDKVFNLTGEFSLKLHKVCLDDSQGQEHSLNYVLEQFMDVYHGYTPEYVMNVLLPLYIYLGYEANNSTEGHQITLNCIYPHENGEMKGVTLGEIPNKTDFNFMIFPLSLYEGFNLTVYVHGQEEPIVLTTDPVVEDPVTNEMRGHFKYGPSFTPDYTWAVKPGARKIYNTVSPINLEFE